VAREERERLAGGARRLARVQGAVEGGRKKKEQKLRTWLNINCCQGEENDKKKRVRYGTTRCSAEEEKVKKQIGQPGSRDRSNCPLSGPILRRH